MEGFKAEPYRDDKGNWTIGWGHFLGNGQTCRISPQVAEMILEEDIHRATFDYLSLGWELNQIRQEVIVEAIFWFGFRGFLRFKKCIAAIEREAWGTASDELMDSEAGRNYPNRMSELAGLMRDG